jgi:hypothetical protein
MSASQNCVGRPSTIHRYGFMRPTKSMEHHFSNAEQDAVRCAFLPSSFIQIRKLPETLKAGSFGQGGIILSETSPRGLPRSAGRLWTGLPPPSRSGDLRQHSALSTGVKSEASIVEGTLSPRRFPVGPRSFSQFTYKPSEYDIEKQKRIKEKEAHAAKIIGPPCIKTGTPTIPAKQGTFTHFRYEIDPYESKDEYWQEVRLQDMRFSKPARVFTPSGRFVAKDDLCKRKASQHELLARLVASLQSDWPDTFRRCFFDQRGLVVCLFTDREHDEGARTELTNYMHQLVKTHPVSTEFVLRKQSARWGRHSNGYIEFALQPPWVTISPYEPYLRSHIEEAAKLQASKKSTSRSRGSSSIPPSRRMAVPPQTPNGTRIYSYLGGEGHLNT